MIINGQNPVNPARQQGGGTLPQFNNLNIQYPTRNIQSSSLTATATTALVRSVPVRALKTSAETISQPNPSCQTAISFKVAPGIKTPDGVYKHRGPYLTSRHSRHLSMRHNQNARGRLASRPGVSISESYLQHQTGSSLKSQRLWHEHVSGP